MPVVPCAQAKTGQPPDGGSPLGASTIPETAISRWSRLREWYRIRQPTATDKFKGSIQMMSPGSPVGRGSRAS
jgi:hypothetical protein